jgi:hypothetical protein
MNEEDKMDQMKGNERDRRKKGGEGKREKVCLVKERGLEDDGVYTITAFELETTTNHTNWAPFPG